MSQGYFSERRFTHIAICSLILKKHIRDRKYVLLSCIKVRSSLTDLSLAPDFHPQARWCSPPFVPELGLSVCTSVRFSCEDGLVKSSICVYWGRRGEARYGLEQDTLIFIPVYIFLSFFSSDLRMTVLFVLFTLFTREGLLQGHSKANALIFFLSSYRC